MADATEYLVVMAIGGRHLIELKGLFDQTSLPLSLALRVVGAVCGTVVLIPNRENRIRNSVPLLKSEQRIQNKKTLNN